MNPAGGLNASTRDIARWARAMSEPARHPLGQRLVEALTTPYVELGTAPDTAYGYGVPNDWQAPAGSPRPLSAYVGTYVDRRSWLRRVRVRLDGDHLVIDYLDGQPAQLPATFAFRFVSGEVRARFLVTVAGVGERVAEE